MIIAAAIQQNGLLDQVCCDVKLLLFQIDLGQQGKSRMAQRIALQQASQQLDGFPVLTFGIDGLRILKSA